MGAESLDARPSEVRVSHTRTTACCAGATAPASTPRSRGLTEQSVWSCAVSDHGNHLVHMCRGDDQLRGQSLSRIMRLVRFVGRVVHLDHIKSSFEFSPRFLLGNVSDKILLLVNRCQIPANALQAPYGILGRTVTTKF